MNKTKDEIHDIKVDGNVVRFVKKKKPKRLYDLLIRTGMLEFEIED